MTGSPTIMECCKVEDVMFNSCEDKIGSCGTGQLVVDVEMRECPEPCLPFVRLVADIIVTF